MPPLKHLRRIGQGARTTDFLKIVEEYVEPALVREIYQDTEFPVMQAILAPSYVK